MALKSSIQSFLQRRRRVLLWCAGILIVYSGLGFLFLPWLAERQLVNTLDERLSIQASVEAIRFNPFTFTLEIEQLDLDEAGSPTLLSLPRLFVNFEPSRLLLGRVRFDEITIQELALYFERHSVTENTLTRLGERWAATAEEEDTEEAREEEADSDGGLITVEVGLFSFNGGSLRYVDQVPDDGFDTTITPISVVVQDFTTREDQTSQQGIEINLEQDAVLTWNGRMTVSPLQASGSLALDNFPVRLPWRYLQGQLPFTVEAGRFAFDLDYSLDYAGETLAMDISNIGAALTGLDVRENGAEQAFLQGGSLTLENGNVAIPDNQIRLEALTLDGFSFSAVRDETGEVNWLAMVEALQEDAGDSTAQTATAGVSGQTAEESDQEAAASPATGSAAGGDGDAMPWRVSLDRLAVDETTFDFSDRVPEQDASVSLSLEVLLEGLDNQPETQIPYHVGIALTSGGELALDGQMQVLPDFSTEATLNVSALSLQPAQAWLNDYALITIENGALNMDASLSNSPEEPFAYRGNISLSSLSLTDQAREETLASLDALTVSEIDLSLAGNSLSVSEVALDAPYARVEIAEDGSTNIGAVMRAEEPEAVTEDSEGDAAASEQVAGEAQGEALGEGTEESEPMHISLGEVRINEARSDFTDHNLPIVFDTQMHALNGQITGFDSRSTQPMAVSLEGQVDEFGLVQIDGEINPLDYEHLTNIDLSFSNLDMPAMSPYVIKFAGRRIDDGRADVSLSYQISEGALMASNAVVLRDLTLGERVEHPDAMDLPLDMAVALLKNGQGVIDLEVPVTGDVNDPQFSVGPAIRTAIVNAITNIVSSPFRLLGSLVGGSEDSIDSIRFQPGRSDIAPPEQEKLMQLTEALAQRPQLVLEIPGVLASEADREVLKTRAVDAAISEQLEQQAQQEETADAQLNERRLQALETLYTAAALTPDLETLRMEHTSSADEDEDSDPVFDALAYSEDLRQRLITAQSISEAALEDLARDRAEAVTAYIGINSTLDASQYRMAETITSELDDDGWLTMSFEVGAAE